MNKADEQVLEMTVTSLRKMADFPLRGWPKANEKDRAKLSKACTKLADKLNKRRRTEGEPEARQPVASDGKDDIPEDGEGGRRPGGPGDAPVGGDKPEAG